MTSILKADTIQDTDGNNIINESGNTITIGASGDTTNIIGTLQNNGAAVGGTNTPAFHAYHSGTEQTVSDNTLTKIEMNSESYDSDNCYDNSSNYRFTPNVAGKYFVYSNVRANEGVDDLYKLQNQINKNGSIIAHIGQTSFDVRNGKGTDAGIYSSGIVDMNGSSDYLEVFAQIDSVSGSDSAVKNSGTFFGAYRIIT
jgi:hypothetical protein